MFRLSRSIVANACRTGRMDLHGMSLTTLPSELFEPEVMRALTTLDLSRNALVTLSPRIAELVHLRELLIDNNALVTLPIELCDLPHLKYISIDDNPRLPVSLRDAYTRSRVHVINGGVRCRDALPTLQWIAAYDGTSADAAMGVEAYPPSPAHAHPHAHSSFEEKQDYAYDGQTRHASDPSPSQVHANGVWSADTMHAREQLLDRARQIQDSALKSHIFASSMADDAGATAPQPHARRGVAPAHSAAARTTSDIFHLNNSSNTATGAIPSSFSPNAFHTGKRQAAQRPQVTDTANFWGTGSATAASITPAASTSIPSGPRFGRRSASRDHVTGAVAVTGSAAAPFGTDMEMRPSASATERASMQERERQGRREMLKDGAVPSHLAYSPFATSQQQDAQQQQQQHSSSSSSSSSSSPFANAGGNEVYRSSPFAVMAPPASASALAATYTSTSNAAAASAFAYGPPPSSSSGAPPSSSFEQQQQQQPPFQAPPRSARQSHPGSSGALGSPFDADQHARTPLYTSNTAGDRRSTSVADIGAGREGGRGGPHQQQPQQRLGKRQVRRPSYGHDQPLSQVFPDQQQQQQQMIYDAGGAPRCGRAAGPPRSTQAPFGTEADVPATPMLSYAEEVLYERKRGPISQVFPEGGGASASGHPAARYSPFAAGAAGAAASQPRYM